MDFSTLGKGIILLGLLLVIVGGLFWLLGRTGLPLGRLISSFFLRLVAT